MHEVALRGQMLKTLADYKSSAMPRGEGVRKMTAEEVDSYTRFAADNYANLQSLDNGPEDQNPATGRIEIQNRSVNDGITDSFPRETTESFQASFGGRSKSYEAIQDISNKPLYDTSDPGYSKTQVEWAEQNIGFIAGISIVRNDNTVQTTQFRIDRLNPANSVILMEEPSTAREL